MSRVPKCNAILSHNFEDNYLKLIRKFDAGLVLWNMKSSKCSLVASPMKWPELPAVGCHALLPQQNVWLCKMRSRGKKGWCETGKLSSHNYCSLMSWPGFMRAPLCCKHAWETWKGRLYVAKLCYVLKWTTPIKMLQKDYGPFRMLTTAECCLNWTVAWWYDELSLLSS